MIKRLVLISALLTTPALAGELLYGGSYVSPEQYAVNEADMIYDYSNIPPAPKLDVDTLENMRFEISKENINNQINSNINNNIKGNMNINALNNQMSEEVQQVEDLSKKAQKEAKKAEKKLQKEAEKASKNDPDEAYKRRLPYKFAKWWVDQRYKREEPHHGSLHEIKVQKRLDYEQRLEEEALKKEQNN